MSHLPWPPHLQYLPPRGQRQPRVAGPGSSNTPSHALLSSPRLPRRTSKYEQKVKPPSSIDAHRHKTIEGRLEAALNTVRKRGSLGGQRDEISQSRYPREGLALELADSLA